MADFEFEQIEGLPGRTFVHVDNRYSVTIIRTAEGLVIDVWPKDWNSPLETLTVWDEDIVVDEKKLTER